MALPSLVKQDIEQLRQWFPTLTFDRADQVHAVLHMDSADFQAAPGSGKTTLLGAKLALLSSKWEHRGRGICVLSHTNVARQEIEQRLKSVSGGDSLLAHPHYVGTIQTFVNRHIALPWLRSKGIELRECDDDAVEGRLLARARANWTIKTWMQPNLWERESLVRGIRYQGADLALKSKSDKGSLPVAGKCIAALTSIKQELSEQGWLCYDDMFSYALQAMRDVPGLVASIAHRFPLVFIDEMQDTNDVQLEVLSGLFDGVSVVQRFGDVNQAILNRTGGAHPASFPGPGYSEVSASLRFGSEIAGVANALKAVGVAMQGDGEAAAMPPTLVVFSDSTVESVAERFGLLVASAFSKEELSRHPVKAVCAVKRPGNLKQPLGRHLPDYFPGYQVNEMRPADANASICLLVREGGSQHMSMEGHARRVAVARMAVVRLIQLFGVAAIRDSSNWRKLTGSLAAYPDRLQTLNAVVLDIVLGAYAPDNEPLWQQHASALVAALANLVEVKADRIGVPELAFDASTAGGAAAGNQIHVSANGRDFDLQFSTIAGVKGETHLATLVLESCHKMRYDVSEVLPYFAGRGSSVPSDVQRISQLRNLFVAVSRPRRMVVLAAHSDRVDTPVRQELQRSGWRVIDWTS